MAASIVIDQIVTEVLEITMEILVPEGREDLPLGNNLLMVIHQDRLPLPW
jgi:hypothetical protein